MSEELETDETIVVLLALGNPSEAVALENHLNDKFPGAMEIYRAPSGFDAMSLAMNKPRIVLLDQRLPDVMGLDMIDPIRDQIGLNNYLVFIGGSGKGGMRPGMRDEALKRGASAICDRPVDVEWLTRMLTQLLYPEIPDHPHLHGLELLDLIQMFHQKRCDRTMRIFAHDGRVGSIYMNKGEITHVEAGAMQGFSAVLDLMRWTEGRIVVYDALLSSERTNDSPTMHLIMEAARMMDEESPDSGEIETSGAFDTPTPMPVEESEPIMRGPEVESVLTALDSVFDSSDENPVTEPLFPGESDDDDDGSSAQGRKRKKDDTLSIPALDLDFDFDA